MFSMAKAATKIAQAAKEPRKKKTSLALTFSEVAAAVEATFKDYRSTSTPRLQLIDAFLAFLVALGVLQFVYVLLVGNFPFNAFLGGFIACVGQFVLTVSLRFFYVRKDELPPRAFGEYVFASLILHFIVIHFIN